MNFVMTMLFHGKYLLVERAKQARPLYSGAIHKVVQSHTLRGKNEANLVKS